MSDETITPHLQTTHPKPWTRNPEPGTQNPKPWALHPTTPTLIPQPQTLKHTSMLTGGDDPGSAAYDLMECMNYLVLESQTQHKMVNLLFTFANWNIKLTVLWGSWLSKTNYQIRCIRWYRSEGTVGKPLRPFAIVYRKFLWILHLWDIHEIPS